MRASKFAIADAPMERSPGQDADIEVGNVVDEEAGGPMSIGYGRYGPDQTLTETMVVDDVMFILEGRISVETKDGTITASPGEIIYMPKGETVTIHSHETGALTAFATFPHWRPARA